MLSPAEIVLLVSDTATLAAEMLGPVYLRAIEIGDPKAQWFQSDFLVTDTHDWRTAREESIKALISKARQLGIVAFSSHDLGLLPGLDSAFAGPFRVTAQGRSDGHLITIDWLGVTR